jgi:hypothetical protein
LARGGQILAYEAGIGVRAMYSLLFLTVVYAHLFSRSIRETAAAFVSLIPVTIAAGAGAAALWVLLVRSSPTLDPNVNQTFEVAATAGIFLVVLIIGRTIAGKLHAQR